MCSVEEVFKQSSFTDIIVASLVLRKLSSLHGGHLIAPVEKLWSFCWGFEADIHPANKKFIATTTRSEPGHDS